MILLKHMKIKSVKASAFQLFLLIILILISGCISDNSFETIIEEIKLKHVPDTREGVFDVRGKLSGRNKIIVSGEVDSEKVKAAINDSLQKRGFDLINNITVLPSEVPWPWALVNLSVANIRASPSHRSELVNQAILGTPLRILKEEGSWVFIQTPDRYLGWLDKSSLSGKTDMEMVKWRESERVIFLNTSGFIKTPETGEVVSDIVAGAVLENIYTEGDKANVVLPDGRKGTVFSEDIAPFDLWRNNIKPLPEKITETAMTMNGFPYLWGGTSVKGIDCSGFTRIVFFLNGLVISRDASLQARFGQELEVNNGWEVYRPGDLLFFRGDPDGAPGSPVIHVGLYTGDSEYIHASGMVKINSLDSNRMNYDEYRHSTLQSARRITPAFYGEGNVPVADHSWY